MARTGGDCKKGTTTMDVVIANGVIGKIKNFYQTKLNI